MAKPQKSQSKAKKPKTPSERLNELGIDAICQFIENGESLSAFAKKHNLALTTVYDWLEDGKYPERSEHYARAREARADNVFDSLDEISDKAVSAETQVEVAGLRLKSDNIKWKLARMHRKYSDRTVLAGDPEAPLGGQRPDLSNLTDEELKTLAELQRKVEGKA
jgi:hypothetical protein